jgi:hypothetical protein
MKVLIETVVLNNQLPDGEPFLEFSYESLDGSARGQTRFERGVGIGQWDILKHVTFLFTACINSTPVELVEQEADRWVPVLP